MSEFYAQPYDLDADGFYFSDGEMFKEKSEKLRNAHGQTVEEFEIQFIDGESIDCELAKAYGIDQANIVSFINHKEKWDDHQKIRFILAIGESSYRFDHEDCDPDSFDIEIYEMASMKELAEQFVAEGLFGEVPNSMQFYVDYEAIARDLSVDYGETTVDGTRYIYRTL